ncbi:MAG: hydroxymethylglutaryl-CoA synthase [Nanoarchaeota archaeon]
MLEVGIEKIAIWLPKNYISSKRLAEHRKITPFDPNRLGIKSLAVPNLEDTPESMALEATKLLLEKINLNNVGKIVIATESSKDLAIPISAFLHTKLKLPTTTEHYEIKFACIGGCYALQESLNWLRNNPDKYAIVVCTDIARYSQGSKAELTQGAGAVSLLLSRKPKISIAPKSTTFSEEDLTFSRPITSPYAIVDGRESIIPYIKAVTQVYRSLKSSERFEHIIIHVPFPSIVRTALLKILKEEKRGNELEKCLSSSLEYPSQTGNIYTGSIFLSLASLSEDKIQQDTPLALIGFGSGCCAKGFSCRLHTLENLVSLNQKFSERTELDGKEYDNLVYPII